MITEKVLSFFKCFILFYLVHVIFVKNSVGVSFLITALIVILSNRTTNTYIRSAIHLASSIGSCLIFVVFLGISTSIVVKVISSSS